MSAGPGLDAGVGGSVGTSADKTLGARTALLPKVSQGEVRPPAVLGLWWTLHMEAVSAVRLFLQVVLYCC